MSVFKIYLTRFGAKNYEALRKNLLVKHLQNSLSELRKRFVCCVTNFNCFRVQMFAKVEDEKSDAEIYMELPFQSPTVK